MNILAFVEDPGAVNGVLPIARFLVSMGHKVFIQLEGYASSLNPSELKGMKIVSDPTNFLMEGVFHLFLTGTSENLNSRSFELIKNCKKVNTVSVGFIDSPANPAHRFSGGSSNPLAHVPDYLIVVDNSTAQAFVSFGLKESEVIVIRDPRIEKVAEVKANVTSSSVRELRQTLFGECSGHEILIVFCSELSEGLQQYRLKKTNEYSLTAPKHIFKRTDVVIFNFLSVVQHLKELGFMLKSVIRLHPKQNENDILQINDFDYISRGCDSIEVCLASDIIVGMSSMILAEAYELDKPVISILPRLTEVEWMPVEIRDKIATCFTKDELFSALQARIVEEGVDLVASSAEKVDSTNDKLVQFLESVSGTV